MKTLTLKAALLTMNPSALFEVVAMFGEELAKSASEKDERNWCHKKAELCHDDQH
jgi:hypothetical protein